ncbi:MAG: acylphosphatase [Sphingobium sp.]
MLTAKRLTISGRVQGVWYRAWCVKTARELALTGWVRNRADGSVETLVQGTQNAVEQFIAQAWNGPPAANVRDIAAYTETISDMRDFEQRASE